MRHADYSHATGPSSTSRWTVPATKSAGVIDAAGVWDWAPDGGKEIHEIFLRMTVGAAWGATSIDVQAVYLNGYVHTISAAVAADTRIAFTGKPSRIRFNATAVAAGVTIGVAVQSYTPGDFLVV